MGPCSCAYLCIVRRGVLIWVSYWPLAVGRNPAYGDAVGWGHVTSSTSSSPAPVRWSRGQQRHEWAPSRRLSLFDAAVKLNGRALRSATSTRYIGPTVRPHDLYMYCICIIKVSIKSVICQLSLCWLVWVTVSRQPRSHPCVSTLPGVYPTYRSLSALLLPRWLCSLCLILGKARSEYPC